VPDEMIKICYCGKSWILPKFLLILVKNISDVFSLKPSWIRVSIKDDTHKLVKKLTQTSYFSLRPLFSDKLLGDTEMEVFLKL